MASTDRDEEGSTHRALPSRPKVPHLTDGQVFERLLFFEERRNIPSGPRESTHRAPSPGDQSPHLEDGQLFKEIPTLFQYRRNSAGHRYQVPYIPPGLRARAFVPTSITVVRYPAQQAHKLDPCFPAEGIHHEDLGTVEVDLMSRFEAGDRIMSDFKVSQSVDQRPDTMFYRVEKGQSQPLVILQPDTEKFWPRSAWEDRAVVGNDKFHVLFTTSSDSNLMENRHVHGKVRGDIFVLKLSDTVGEDGFRYYADMELGEWEKENKLWEDFVKEIIGVKEAHDQLS